VSANGRLAAFGTAVVVALGHVSGAFAHVEEEISPSLTTGTIDMFHVLDAGGFGAAKSVLQGLAKGDNNDKLVRAATCAFLNGSQSLAPQHASIVAGIYAGIPYEDRALFGVRQAVNNVANKLQGLTAPGSYSRLYYAACFTRAD